MEDDDLELERLTVDSLCPDSDYGTLSDALQSYIDSNAVSPKRNKMNEICFIENRNGIVYKGSMSFYYWNAAENVVPRKNLGKCLYITQFIISPRGGNIIEPILRQEIFQMPLIDSIYIESILSTSVQNKYAATNWTRVNGNHFYLVKIVGGRSKKDPKKDPKKGPNGSQGVK